MNKSVKLTLDNCVFEQYTVILHFMLTVFYKKIDAIECDTTLYRIGSNNLQYFTCT
jgi:hypothetical protein